MDNKCQSDDDLKICLDMITYFPDDLKKYILNLWQYYHHENDSIIMSDFIYLDLNPNILTRFLCGACLVIIDDGLYNIKWLDLKNITTEKDINLNKVHHYYSPFFQNCNFGPIVFNGKHCTWIQLTRKYPNWYNIIDQFTTIISRLIYGEITKAFAELDEDVDNPDNYDKGPYGISSHNINNPILLRHYETNDISASMREHNNPWLSIYSGYTVRKNNFLGFTLT